MIGRDPVLSAAVPGQRGAGALTALIEHASHGPIHVLAKSTVQHILASGFVESLHDLRNEGGVFGNVDGEIPGKVSKYVTAERS